MAIEVQIAAIDDFADTAKRAAVALEQIADREKLIVRYAKALGVAEGEAARAVAQVAKEQKASEAAAARAARAAEAQVKREQANVRRARALQERFEAKEAAANKARFESMKKAYEVGSRIATAVAAAGVAAVAAAAGLAHLADEAGRGARESRALMHGLTGGRGARALELVDQLAGRLGVRFEEAREQFARFREAGATNRMSAALIKTRADLVAFGLSAEAADNEIQRVLSRRGNSAQAAALAEIHRTYEGVGSGALAAAAATNTVDGAMARLSNASTKALEELWDRIGPHVTRAANALASFVESFTKTERGRAALDRIAQGFQIVAGAAENTFNLLENHWPRVFRTFETTTTDSLTSAALGPLGSLFVGANRSLARASETGRQAGRNTAAGFAQGIRSGQREADATATGFADSIANAFRNALGIHSPSRLFAEFGANTVEGFEQGQQDAIPSAMPLERAASGTIDNSISSTGGSVVIQQLIVNAPSDNPEDIAIAVRVEMQRLLSAMSKSRGRPS